MGSKIFTLAALVLSFYVSILLIDSARDKPSVRYNCVVKWEKLDVMSERSKSSTIVGTLEPGSECVCIFYDGDWNKVEFNGKDYWVDCHGIKAGTQIPIPERTFQDKWNHFISHRGLIPIIIMILAIFMWPCTYVEKSYFRPQRRADGTYTKGSSHTNSRPFRYTFVALMLLMTALTLYYYYTDPSIFWFFNFDGVYHNERENWWRYGLMLIFFVVYIYSYIRSFHYVFDVCLDYKPLSDHYVEGAIIALVSGVACVAVNVFFEGRYLTLIIIAACCLQLLLAIMDIWKHRERSFWEAIVSNTIYLVTIGTATLVLSIVIFYTAWALFYILIGIGCLLLYAGWMFLTRFLAAGADNVVLEDGTKLKKKTGIFDDGTEYKEEGLFGDDYKSDNGEDFWKQ